MQRALSSTRINLTLCLFFLHSIFQTFADISDDPNSALGARLRDDYYPGDLGFDPLRLKPKSENGFKIMQTKELQNGRLAMIAAIGMITQEQITHETIAETLQGMF